MSKSEDMGFLGLNMPCFFAGLKSCIEQAEISRDSVIAIIISFFMALFLLSGVGGIIRAARLVGRASPDR